MRIPHACWPSCLSGPAHPPSRRPAARALPDCAPSETQQTDTLQRGGCAYGPAPINAPVLARDVAVDFGAPHGTPISNAATVMQDLYRALGHDKPPAVIGIFVEPYNNIMHTDAAGVGLNPFGHAAMAYTRDGVTRLMNISGSKTKPMVNFMSLEDYLFGVDNFETGNEQGSIYNRTYRLMCVWDWPAPQIEAMHQFYTELDQRARRGKARFSQIFSRVFNLWPSKTHWGNCAMWTAQGLVAADLAKRATMWPKQMAVQLLEKIDAQDPNNISCVWLPRVAHAQLSFGRGAGQRGMVSPYRAYRNCLYWDLGHRAQATLSVPAGTMVAQPYVL